MPYTPPSRSRSGNTTPDHKNKLQVPESLDSCQGTLQFQKLMHSQSESFNMSNMKRSATSKFYLIDNDSNDNLNEINQLNKFTTESTQSYSYTPISNNSLTMRLNVLKRSLEILLDNPNWVNPSLDSTNNTNTNTNSNPDQQDNQHHNNKSIYNELIKLDRNLTSTTLRNLLTSTMDDRSIPTEKRSNSVTSINSYNSLNESSVTYNQELLNDLRDMLKILDKFQSNDTLELTEDLEEKMLLLHNLSLSNTDNDSTKQRANLLRIKLLNALATPFIDSNTNSNKIAGIPMLHSTPSSLGLSNMKMTEMSQVNSSSSSNSSILSPQQQYQQPTQTQGRQFHASSNAKTKSPKAVFTVSIESPWELLNANDLGLLMFGFSRNSLTKMKLLDLIAPRSRDLVINRLSRDHEIVFSGEIIAVKRDNTTVAWTSLWAKRRDNLIILIFEQVVCETIDIIIERDGSMSSEFYVKEIIKQSSSLYNDSLKEKPLSMFLPTIDSKIKKTEIDLNNIDLTSLQDSNIINEIRYFTLLRENGDYIPTAVTSEYLKMYENKDVIDQSIKSLIRINLHSLPYIAGTFIISSKTYEIQSFNEAIATNLFGTNKLKLRSIDKIIPSFTKLIKLALNDNPNMNDQDGLVLPEHYFRKLFVSLNTKDESECEASFLKCKGVEGRHHDGNPIKIDIQLHVQSNDLYLLWITFSRISPKPPVNNKNTVNDESKTQYHYHSYDDSTESNSLPSQLVLFNNNDDEEYNGGSESYSHGSTGSNMSRTSSVKTVIHNNTVSAPTTPRQSDNSVENSNANLIGTEKSEVDQFGSKSIKQLTSKEMLIMEETKLQYLKLNSPNFPKTIGAEKRTKRFSDFKVLKNLGEGAYGKVVFAQYKNDELYKDCIKAIFKERILVDTWVRDRKLGTIPSEIQILYALNTYPHANIMRIVDFFEDENCYYLETLQHGSQSAGAVDLYDIIEVKNEMTEFEEKYIYYQITAALAHMHAHGIVHRDIKDENIIVDNDYFVKLIDFGSAAWVKDGPFGVFVGTIDYAAPEVLNGQPYEGKSQDVWAMGVLLYTLVFKENPFCSVDEILDGEIKFPAYSGVSDDCIDLIKSILITDVNKRPSMQEILQHRWLNGFS